MIRALLRKLFLPLTRQEKPAPTEFEEGLQALTWSANARLELADEARADGNFEQAAFIEDTAAKCHLQVARLRQTSR